MNKEGVCVGLRDCDFIPVTIWDSRSQLPVDEGNEEEQKHILFITFDVVFGNEPQARKSGHGKPT